MSDVYPLTAWGIEMDGYLLAGSVCNTRSEADTALAETIYSFGSEGVHLVRLTIEREEEEFDPAYLYSDKDGEIWEYLDGKWVQGDSRTDRLVSANVNHGLNNLLPKYGPYTRIEEYK